MDRLTLDLRQIDRVDVNKLGFPLVPAVPRHPLQEPERSGLKSALGFGKTFNPRLALALEAVSIADHPPSVTVLAPPPTPAPLVKISSKTALRRRK